MSKVVVMFIVNKFIFFTCFIIFHNVGNVSDDYISSCND